MSTHQDKVAIITGGKQGIGRGIANLLAQRGENSVIINLLAQHAQKYVLDNRQDAAKEATEIGNGAIAIGADVTSEADWARVAAEVEQKFGRADILVHAAGIYPIAGLDRMTQEEW